MNILESLLLLVFRHFSDIPAYLIEIWSVSLTLRFTYRERQGKNREIKAIFI